MNFTPVSKRRGAVRGFSLIELLIGIVIGLVGMLAIFQVVTVWDSHNRTTTAGGDADVAGTLAMFTLERDIREAGMGMKPTTGSQLDCNSSGFTVDDVVKPPARVLPFHPIEIVVKTDGTPDQVNVLHGDTSFMPAPDVFSLSTATTKTITPNRHGLKPGDLVIVTGNSTQPCSLVEITAGATSGGLVTHAPGNYTTYYPDAAASSVAARFNGAAGAPTAYSGGALFNLGPAPQLNWWKISATGVLQRDEQIFLPGVVDVAEGVINIKAQYGLDANSDQLINSAEWTATAPTATKWGNVLAVRVAILVRSKQWERSASGSASGVPTGVTVTAPQPSWVTCAVPAGCGGFGMTNLDGSPDTFGPNDADPNNWRYYRYRVYEKVIPLRNMIWSP